MTSRTSDFESDQLIEELKPFWILDYRRRQKFYDDDNFDDDNDSDEDNGDDKNLVIDRKCGYQNDGKRLQKKIKYIMFLMKDQLGVCEHLCAYPLWGQLVALTRFELDADPELAVRRRIMQVAINLGNRLAVDLLVKHSDSHQIISSLWVAVRNRGCQFLGPAIQELVLRLIILALGDGAPLTRKVLILYILDKIKPFYPSHATKTSVGHVVQILYRAGCFELIQRHGQSCLMVLEPQYQMYDALRREHDAQIVSIALESGIRLSTEQWSSLLYGDNRHESHMQSILNELKATNAPFKQVVKQLKITVLENEYAAGYPAAEILNTIPYFEKLIHFEMNMDKDDEETFSMSNLFVAIDSIIFITGKLICFINYAFRKNGTFSLYKNPMRNYFI